MCADRTRASQHRWWHTLVPVCYLLVSVGLVSGQSCTTVAIPFIACEEKGMMSVSLTCPEKYIIKLVSASYLVSDGSTCPQPDASTTGHCLANDKLEALSACHKTTSCTQSIFRDNSGTCSGSGVHYIRALYYCEPLHYHNTDKAGLTTVLSSTPLTGKQLVYVASHLKALSGTDVSFSNTSVACQVSVPDRTQVALQLIVMTKNPPQSDCNQRVQFWDGARYQGALCNVSAMTVAGCDVSRNTFYFRYLNSDPDVSAAFVVSVGVSHLVPGFDLQCGLDVINLPPVEPTTTTTTPSTSTVEPVVGAANSGQSGDTVQDATLIIILGSVAGFLVVLVVIVGVLIKVYSKRTTLLEETDDQSEGPQGFVREVYLDGENSSKLVMGRNRQKSGLDGSLSLHSHRIS